VTAMSTATGVGIPAHGVHHAMVPVGLLGPAALLLPQGLRRRTGLGVRAVGGRGRGVCSSPVHVAPSTSHSRADYY
jgi:hypothetical protein